MQKVLTHQCAFGLMLRGSDGELPAKKPTTFLLVNLAQVGRKLAALPCGGRCQHTYRHQVSIGLDEEGYFKTSPLKDYPPGLCELIAVSVHEAWRHSEQIRQSIRLILPVYGA